MTIQVPPRNPAQDRPDYWLPSPERRNGGGSGSTAAQWHTLVEVGQSLLRHKAPMLWMAAFGAVAALVASAIQPRVYQSRATIQIQGLNENFLSLRDIYPTAAPSADNVVYVQTQAEMLRQDALVEEVVRNLRLESRPEFHDGSAAPNPASDIRSVVEQVKKNLQIVPSRGSSIIQIISDARDPQVAADIANGLGQTFIEQSIQTRQHAAKETEAALSAERDQLRRKILQSRAELGPFGGMDVPGARIPASTEALRREADANRQLYEALSRRVDEARLASTLSHAGIRLVGPAQPATHPYKPNLLLNLVLGIFAGVGIGLAFVMLRDQTDTRMHAPGDASACLGVPELGVVPKAGSGALPGLRLGAAPAATPVERASFDQPSSEVSESFRAIVASILAGGHNGDHPRVLLVTSSRPLEGKTTVVSNLGIALTELGGRVLLIDGDLRHPRLHKIFDQANSWGLSDLLREKNAIEDLPLESLVKKTAVPRLYLLPSGTSADHIFGLLWSGRLGRLLPRFREEFDYVLVDAPPCLPFADARIMGRQVEKVLLVVRADSTDSRAAQAALQRLAEDGIPTMGAILNCCDLSNHGSYGYANGNGRKDLA